MNESIKAILGLIIVVCVLAGIFAWMPGISDEVTTTLWWVRVGTPCVGVLCLAPLVWAQMRKDKAPDFLASITPQYFERDGFCFAVVLQVVNGSCFMNIFFQNRYDRPCSAQVLVRATSGIFNEKVNIPDVMLGVDCGPGEFGRSIIPWAIPRDLQGQTVSLCLYAGVKYTGGRGTLLRYRDGIRVGAVGLDFWREGLQIASALGGNIMISRPARIKVALPSGVSTTREEKVIVDTQTIWKLGDPVTLS